MPLHADLKGALESWDSSPYVVNCKGASLLRAQLRLAWQDLMNRTAAGRIKKAGYVFHGLAPRAARSCARSAA